MVAIILVLYFLLIAMFVLGSFFVVYHIVKFSLNSEMKLIGLVAFVVVAAGLLFSNLLLFFSIDWAELIEQFVQ